MRLKVARGEYIYFIDSDDYIELNALEYLYSEAVRDDLDVLMFDGVSFYEPPEYAKEFPGQDCCYRPCEFAGIMTGQEMYLRMREKNVFRPMVALTLIRRRYLIDTGILFREGIVHEDVPFTTLLVLEAKRVGHRNKVLYHYRRRRGAITDKVVKFERIYGRLIGIQIISDYMYRNICNPDIERYLVYYLNYLRRDMMLQFNSLPHSEKSKLSELTEAEKAYFKKLSSDGDVSFSDIDVIPLSDREDIPEIIVSLTSYPARIDAVGLVIERLLDQSYPADRIILNLADAQFKNRKLPAKLKELESSGAVTINWCDDLKSHKKYFCTMQQYPEAVIITVGDDELYSS
ncbi:MAG: hypothetical protein HUJ65_00165, partial [Oscillospiraceae bacterium]|nr:hypothetical protein [Oscillospiraceae bacterium]